MCQYVICHIYVCYINIYELGAWWKTISFRHKSLCIIYHQNYISIDLIYGISSKWTVLAFPSYWARFRINFVSIKMRLAYTALDIGSRPLSLNKICVLREAVWSYSENPPIIGRTGFPSIEILQTWLWNVKTKTSLCNFGNYHCCIFPKYNCSWQCLPEKDWYKIDVCSLCLFYAYF